MKPKKKKENLKKRQASYDLFRKSLESTKVPEGAITRPGSVKKS